jgi:hypothetical protein
MSDKKSVQSPKDNILISDKTGNGAAAQLAEEELEQGNHPASTAGKLNLRCSKGMEQSFGP